MKLQSGCTACTGVDSVTPAARRIRVFNAAALTVTMPGRAKCLRASGLEVTAPWRGQRRQDLRMSS